MRTKRLKVDKMYRKTLISITDVVGVNYDGNLAAVGWLAKTATGKTCSIAYHDG